MLASPAHALHLIACVLTIAAAFTPLGCSQQSQPADASITPPIIDMHTHLFNARDLPLAGIASSMGAPDGVAESLAILLNWWTPDHDDDNRFLVTNAPRAAVKSDLPSVAAAIRATVNSRPRADRLAPQSLFEPLTPAQRAELLAWVGQPPLSPRLLAAGTPDSDQFEVEAVARLLAKAQFPPGDSKRAPAALRFQATDVAGYLRFLGVITSSHSDIARQLSIGQYPEVTLFVHHMMDMQSAYASVPAVTFDKQPAVAQSLDAAFNGRLLHFVAFDPFRRADALPFIIRGLAAGATGVKFYPPSGYRAALNVIEPPPTDPAAAKRWQSRYGGNPPLDAAALDALTDQLFQYCAANDIPIFTHCTPFGFEAAPNYGEKSDPQYWAAALKKHPTLRLCFGHAGGDDYWFSPLVPTTNPPADASFGKDVVTLCLTYANVYCETGYLEEIDDPAQRKNLRDRLANVINQKSTPAPGVSTSWHFGDKIMYGTDWFMIAKEPHPEKYLHEFWTLFADPALLPWRRNFFARNAIQFLNLQQLITRPDRPYTPQQRHYWQTLINAAKSP